MKRPSFALLATLVLSACPADDEGDDGGTTVSTTNTTPATTGADESGSDSGGMSETSAADGSTSGGGGATPVVEMVVWTQDPACVAGTVSSVDVVITVSDADNDVSELTFEGIVVGCTGDLDSAEKTITCPQLSAYGGMVTVTDPDGNDDTFDFMIDVCMDGSAP